MLLLKAFLFLLLLYVSKGDDNIELLCKNNYTDMKNRPIGNLKKYCRNKLCVLKCCGEGELFGRGPCTSVPTLQHNLGKSFSVIKKQFKEQYDYTKIQLYSWDGNGVKKSKRKSTDIEFILNQQNTSACTADWSASKDIYILQDGSLKTQDKDISKAWGNIRKLKYCVEYKLVNNKEHPVLLIMREPYLAPDDDDDTKIMYTLIGFLISIFFLVLVLVIYSLLPERRNLIGLIMMAYVSSLILLFTLKCIIILTNKSQTDEFCKTISPMLYFVTLSSFFWLNIMAVNAFLTLRRPRTTSMNKRVKYRKFMKYGLHAWGTPLLITTIVTVLDNIDISNLHIKKPPFVDCMAVSATEYYLVIPVGILISINIILFLLTVFHIWKVKRAVSNLPNSTKSSRQNNNFFLCVKLSLLMGVTWIVELFHTKGIVLFVLMNTFNILLGAAIFFLFVFEKSVFVKLCLKFKIDNEYVRNYESSQHPRSGTTRSTRLSTFKKKGESEDIKMNTTGNGLIEESAAA